MDLNKIENFVKVFSRHGFIVLRSKEAEEFLNVLRSSGAIHLVQIYRLPRSYVLIEVNRMGCIKECDTQCRDVITGKRTVDCYLSCIDRCILDKVRTLCEKVKSFVEAKVV